MTFRPKITEKSREIFDAMIKKGKACRPEDRAKTYKVRGDNKDPGHEEDTFMPKINHRSDRKQMGAPVFDRLYNKAMERDHRRREFESKYLADHVRNVPTPFSAIVRDVDSKYAGMALSGVERSQLREGRQRAPSSAVPATDFMNEVEFKQEHKFILKHLGQAM